jgi:hypothetical protein
MGLRCTLKGTEMAKAKPGDPGQAGTYDPKKGGKFVPEPHKPFPDQTNYPEKTGRKPKKK